MVLPPTPLKRNITDTFAWKQEKLLIREIPQYDIFNSSALGPLYITHCTIYMFKTNQNL